MNEKEKIAIANIKLRRKIKVYDTDINQLEENIDIILNLIEKQQKEIEEKDKYIKAIANIRIQDCKENYSDVIDKYFISKDKIREKINKLKKNDIEYSETIAILEKILAEN